MRQLDEMLQYGICRVSNSPWSSRVLLVTKKDGSKRFCVDFRELNKVTRIDSYPMPLPKDILDWMHGDKFYSFLGGASAYWSIQIEEEDKYKTAFSTPNGLYEFNRMPLGLVNSGSTYQRLMDETRMSENSSPENLSPENSYPENSSPENPSLLPPKLEGIDASTPNYIVLTVIIAKDTYLLIGNNTN